MNFARLGLWLLRRERASGEWRVLLLALDHRRRQRRHHRLSRRPPEARDERTGCEFSWRRPAGDQSAPDQALAAPHAHHQPGAIEFTSMVAKGDAFQLATLRAVDAAYPLARQRAHRSASV